MWPLIWGFMCCMCHGRAQFVLTVWALHEAWLYMASADWNPYHTSCKARLSWLTVNTDEVLSHWLPRTAPWTSFIIWHSAFCVWSGFRYNGDSSESKRGYSKKMFFWSWKKQPGYCLFSDHKNTLWQLCLLKLQLCVTPCLWTAL